MSARHGVADTGEFRQKESVAATTSVKELLPLRRKFVKELLPLRRKFVKELLPLRRKFVKERECVLRQRIYRKNLLISGSKRRT